MNAPLPVNLDTIESYSALLSENFVEETLARSAMIAENKKDSLKSSLAISTDCKMISKELERLRMGLEQSVDCFSRLEALSKMNADRFTQASKILRLSAQKIEESAARRRAAVR